VFSISSDGGISGDFVDSKEITESLPFSQSSSVALSAPAKSESVEVSSQFPASQSRRESIKFEPTSSLVSVSPVDIESSGKSASISSESTLATPETQTETDLSAPISVSDSNRASSPIIESSFSWLSCDGPETASCISTSQSESGSTPLSSLSRSASAIIATPTAEPLPNATLLESSQFFAVSSTISPPRPTDDPSQVGGTVGLGLALGLALLVLMTVAVAGLYFLFVVRRRPETEQYSGGVQAQVGVTSVIESLEEEFKGITEVAFTDGSFAERAFEETAFPDF
jgi:hypothetical protein